MSESQSWTCDGIAKDGKQHPEQSPAGAHPPLDNDGGFCNYCNLPREAVVLPKGGNKLPLGVIVGAGGLIFIGLSAWWALGFFSGCPQGQTKIRGVCITASSPSPSPSSPTPTNNTPGSLTSNITLGEYTSLAEVPNVPQVKVRYGGSTSFAPLRSPTIEQKLEESHPGFDLVYVEPPSGEKPGSGSGIRMLIDGQISFAQSSRGLKDPEIDQGRSRNVILEQQPVAIDGLAIYINKELADKIKGLTLEQVKEIFTGKITNWQEVGGPNLKITPFSRDPEDGGTPEFFRETVLEEGEFSSQVKPYVRDTTESLRKVAATSGGIGYATASETCNQSTVVSIPLSKTSNSGLINPCQGQQVNIAEFANDNYPITRRLFVIIKRDGGLDEQSGVAYVNLLLSREGQQLVQEAGLVPLRSF